MASSPEASDDDSVSVTSTVASEPRESYELESILAEKLIEGVTRYLVKWAGYSDLRCTWEVKENFHDQKSLHHWRERKMRINRGLEIPYDVEALESRISKSINETRKRKAKRRRKIIALGMPVTDLEDDESGDYSSNAVSSSDESLSDRRPPPAKRSRPSREPSYTTSSSEDSEESDEEANKKITPWTAGENQILIASLEELEGWYCGEIHYQHAHPGVKSKLLRGRTQEDLEEQARRLRREYEDAGTPLPKGLTYVRRPIDASATRKPAFKRKKVVVPSRQRRGSSQTKGANSNNAASPTTEDQRSAVKAPKRTFHEVSGKASPVKTTSDSVPLSKPIGKASLVKNTGNRAPLPKPIGEMNKKTRPTTSNIAMGRSSGVKGPAAYKPEPHKGAGILANWDAPKQRRLWGTGLNAGGGGEKQANIATKLSTRNRYQKYSKAEPPPQIEDLRFLDGKPPFAASPQRSSTFAETVRGGQAQRVRQKESDPLFLPRSKPGSPATNKGDGDLNDQVMRDAFPQLYKAPTAPMFPPRGEESNTQNLSSGPGTSKPNLDARKGVQHQDSDTPLSPLTQKPDHPRTAAQSSTTRLPPRGPSAERRKSISLDDYARRKQLSVNTNMRPPPSPAVASSFETPNMSSPSPDITCIIKIGPEENSIGDVKFNGLSERIIALLAKEKIDGKITIYCKDMINFYDYKALWQRAVSLRNLSRQPISQLNVRFERTDTRSAWFASWLYLPYR